MATFVGVVTILGSLQMFDYVFLQFNKKQQQEQQQEQKKQKQTQHVSQSFLQV